MALTVAMTTGGAMNYPQAGGYLWNYLNWALALRDLGARIHWLEGTEPTSASELANQLHTLRARLEEHGLDAQLAVFGWDGSPIPTPEGANELADLVEADLHINFAYWMPGSVVKRFRRSALIDVDPGLLQLWMSAGQVDVAPHDLYFTTGETVGTPTARFSDCGISWHHAPPPVYLGMWSAAEAGPEAPYTTVSHWSADEWITLDGQHVHNDKRSGFQPYLDLPPAAPHALELALLLGDDERDERVDLEQRGWRVRHAWEVAGAPQLYREYIRGSRGEFSCAKPSCRLLSNAWVSDRTLCYLASGKPAIVEHTGPSHYLPDAEGMFRFRSFAEAVRALELCEADYARHCRAARALAEAHFDAVSVVRGVLETALP